MLTHFLNTEWKPQRNWHFMILGRSGYLSRFKFKTTFTTAGRKTDTFFEFFWVFLHACHTVNNTVIALKLSEGFVHGLTFLGEKTELIYLYLSSFYTCSNTKVQFFEKRIKRCALLNKRFFLLKIFFEWLKVSKKFQDSQFPEDEPFKHNSKITKLNFFKCNLLEIIWQPLFSL